jgi:hypothetical protein
VNDRKIVKIVGGKSQIMREILKSFLEVFLPFKDSSHQRVGGAALHRVRARFFLVHHA